MESQNEDGLMNVAQVLVKCLENEGVKYIFGIPGEENLDVMNALIDSSIKFVTVRHEQGAAFMADVHGRLTGKAGVCLSTLGPGATNLITGVADANSDGAPVVAITGQVDTNRMHITSHQYLDLVKLFEPITKRTKQIVCPDSTNEIVRIAFKYSENEKPGATHIDLPKDIAKLKVSSTSAQIPMNHAFEHTEYARPFDIEAAAKMIIEAKCPIILAGHGAVRNHAAQAITDFATNLSIPVINTMMAKGIIPKDNPYAMLTMGIPQKDYQNILLDRADLVIAIGYDIVEFSPAKWNGNEQHKIIHIDVRPAHVHVNYQPQALVIGDISDSLNQIAKLSIKKEEPKRAFAIKEMAVNESKSYEKDNSFPVKPQRVLSDVRKIMGKSDIVISDVGAHKMWIARHYDCYEPNTCIISNGFASMGIAVPGAVAAKMIFPDKKVLAITGDGGFMMNSQELETAFRMKTPIVVLIFTDESYGLIKWKQDDYFGNHCFVDFTNPDFVKYAESMHAKGYRVERAEDLTAILEDAFKQNVPCVIDCPIDYSENSKLTKHLKNVAQLVNSKLENI